MEESAAVAILGNDVHRIVEADNRPAHGYLLVRFFFGSFLPFEARSNSRTVDDEIPDFLAPAEWKNRRCASLL